MGRYHQRDTAGPIGTGAHDFENSLNATAGGSSTDQPVSVPALGFGNWTFLAPEGQGALNWTTTGYGFQYEIVASGADCVHDWTYVRISSDTNTQRSGTSGTGANSGTGLFTSSSDTWSNVNLDASRASTDLYCPRVSGNNANMMTAQTVTVRINTSDHWTDVPWTVSGGPVDPPGRRPVTRRIAVHRAVNF